MRLPRGSLGDPTAEEFDPRRRETPAGVSRRHALVVVVGRDPPDQLAPVGIARHDGPLAAGSVVHHFTLEATDLPSGVYLYRVTGEDFVETRNVVLAR